MSAIKIIVLSGDEEPAVDSYSRIVRAPNPSGPNLMPWNGIPSKFRVK
jgi:hypothetical protein